VNSEQCWSALVVHTVVVVRSLDWGPGKGCFWGRELQAVAVENTPCDYCVLEVLSRVVPATRRDETSMMRCFFFGVNDCHAAFQSGKMVSEITVRGTQDVRWLKLVMCRVISIAVYLGVSDHSAVHHALRAHFAHASCSTLLHASRLTISLHGMACRFMLVHMSARSGVSPPRSHRYTRDRPPSLDSICARYGGGAFRSAAHSPDGSQLARFPGYRHHKSKAKKVNG